MNKLLAITVVIAFLALGGESFRVPREAEEEKGTIATVVDTLRSYYDSSIDTASGYVETIKGYKLDEKAKSYYDSSIDAASGYVETIKGYKLDEKAKSLYQDTVRAVSTYAGIFNDQLYHMLYQQDSS
ncbi:hypothetical protein Q8A67_007800 [Cirrhinus molitorella]|uniref:Apolipoprotein C-II n=1 Tax=Cirrhinus molitorella TaxID=172907 RepID=A0AA88U0M7_9TELE|nr:hypothetical protein Q8A67_007800 [Cirrhinus molitorella]